MQAIPVIKRLTHLPIIIDPSHAGGKWWLVEPMAKAAVAAGCDGLMIEVHNDPEHALCDGPQSLKTREIYRIIETGWRNRPYCWKRNQIKHDIL